MQLRRWQHSKKLCMKIHIWFCPIGILWIQILVTGMAFHARRLEIMSSSCKIPWIHLVHSFMVVICSPFLLFEFWHDSWLRWSIDDILYISKISTFLLCRNISGALLRGFLTPEFGKITYLQELYDPCFSYPSIILKAFSVITMCYDTGTSWL